MIQLEGIKKSFGEKVVLNGIDLTIPNGRTTCIIGKSGSGKSVLLKHIVGLLPFDSGTVTIDNQKLQSISRDDMYALRKRIGFVFQGAALFDSLNVFENIVTSLVEHGEKNTELLLSESKRVLSAVGLLPDISEQETAYYQREYNLLANKKPSDLSGGMRKRVGVARALVGSPEYIMYDEPTTGLDPVTSQQIDDLVADLATKLNVTSVVITHDMFSVFNIAHSVNMIADGVIRFSGNVQELKQSTDPEVVDFLARYVAEGF